MSDPTSATTFSPAPHATPNVTPGELLGRALESKPLTGDPHAWQPPGPEALQALLHGYEVQQFIARGGMGAVYRGLQTSLGRQVAIKILPSELRDADPHYAARFKQEARAMAQLNHPAIVSVYDFGEMPDGTFYFIMEFIEGTDVGQMVARHERLASAHAMAITAHVCDALQYAHERGIVHRDIKPANIMVGFDGRVKVADFGLAKSIRQVDTGLTLSGFVMGTPHFVAPEAMIMGVSVDHRADIYAVGVMLYQMLTGKVPQGLFEMPSLQVPGLDPRYDAIVSSAMRENRDHRYQHIIEMRHALDAIVTQPVQKNEAVAPTVPATLPAKPAQPQERQGRQPSRAQPPSAPPPVVKKKSSAVWITAAVASIVLIGGFIWMQRDTQPAPAPAPATPEVIADTKPPAEAIAVAEPVKAAPAPVPPPPPVEPVSPVSATSVSPDRPKVAESIGELQVRPPPSPGAVESKAAFRTFTDVQGRTLTAALVRVQGDEVLLKRENGQELIVKASTLGAADIAFLKTKGLEMPAPVASTPAPPPAAPAAPPPVSELPIPEESKFSIVHQTTIFGLSRADVSSLLDDPAMKSNPKSVLTKVQGMVASNRASLIANLAVSARSGTRTRMEGDYGCESDIILNPDGSLKASFAIATIRPSASVSKLVVMDVAAKRGETRFLGAFEEDEAGSKLPVRLVFVTFH